MCNPHGIRLSAGTPPGTPGVPVLPHGCRVAPPESPVRTAPGWRWCAGSMGKGRLMHGPEREKALPNDRAFSQPSWKGWVGYQLCSLPLTRGWHRTTTTAFPLPFERRPDPTPRPRPLQCPPARASFPKPPHSPHRQPARGAPAQTFRHGGVGAEFPRQLGTGGGAGALGLSIP